ncbi:tyrosine-type recombinase/integrase [Sphingomonas citricola]|uniref:tyrosine-type recombinase/integrase n=1 Tax=Sphingomonas citricola TaxID=2862498 RepID=UPI002156389D|nr:site-specific integrase [Sphingomonas citricola]
MMHEGNQRKSAREKLRLYNRDVKPFIGDNIYFHITHKDLANILQAKLAVAPIASNRLESLLKRLFRWATTKGRHVTDLTVDPSEHLTKFALSKSRERVMVDQELKLFVNVLNKLESSFTDPLIVALYTGARRGEVFGLRWAELNLDRGEWILPKSRTKNGQELLLPLSQPTVDLLDKAASKREPRQQLVWPTRLNPQKPMSGFSKITKTLNELMEKSANNNGIYFEPITIHDIRRSVGTGMNGLLNDDGHPVIPPHVVERVLNHKLPGLQAVYNRHNYYAEKKAALRVWAEHLEALRKGGAD